MEKRAGAGKQDGGIGALRSGPGALAEGAAWRIGVFNLGVVVELAGRRGYPFEPCRPLSLGPEPPIWRPGWDKYGPRHETGSIAGIAAPALHKRPQHLPRPALSLESLGLLRIATAPPEW